MELTVLYFAQVRQAAVSSSEAIEVEEGAALSDVVEEVVRRHPGLEPFRSSLLLTRNQEWAKPGTPVQEGDEIGLMPPVSGG